MRRSFGRKAQDGDSLVAANWSLMPGAREVARRFALRIRTQAVLLSVVPLTFLVLLCVIASVLQHKTDQIAMLSQRSTNALNEADLIQKLLTEANRSVVGYTRHPRPNELDNYRAAIRDLTELGPSAVGLGVAVNVSARQSRPCSTRKAARRVRS